jgi:hypothetical protein
MTHGNMWEYGQNQSDWDDTRLVGYKVEATDGSIGKIDKATSEAGAQSVVVNTSSVPLFGQKVLLPAGVIDRVDHDDKKVYVSRSKDSIKNAPEFDEATYQDPTYRENLGGYYGDGGVVR